MELSNRQLKKLCSILSVKYDHAKSENKYVRYLCFKKPSFLLTEFRLCGVCIDKSICSEVLI